MRGWFERAVLSVWFSSNNRSAMTGLLSLCLRLFGFFSKSTLERKSARQAQARYNSPSIVATKVIVVGNVIAGGAGKTPLSMAIGMGLAKRGLRVGYLASGYGSSAYEKPQLVDHNSTATEVGDEPLLIFKKTRAAVAVGQDRATALEMLCSAVGLDVVISDDGLQHETLRRDVEIVVFDERFAGNERLLPAGPLREPLARLKSVDVVFAPEKLYSRINQFVDLNRTDLSTSHWQLDGFCTLRQYVANDVNKLLNEQEFAHQVSGLALHAVAGIANPEKFLAVLRECGLRATLHSPGDHKLIPIASLKQLLTNQVVMTEKDAVKYLELVGSTDIDMTNCWVAVGHADVNDTCLDAIHRRVTFTR
jgi:tetraacyldisaccharide 4'-kinase